MSSSNEDQDQSMEDLTTMTIESLRSRLLSERAISRSAMQRADDLAKRVVELEEQLRIVSIQRKKAEMATVDVLAILESNEISDVSNAYDSSSDRDMPVYESKLSNESRRRIEPLTDSQDRRIDHDTYSSSEIDSSSTAGSLSRKSNKDSLNYIDDKKNIESIKRRSSSFGSSGSLQKRLSKSCRRIRRKDTRAQGKELRNDNIRGVLEDSVGISPVILTKEPKKHRVNDVTESCDPDRSILTDDRDEIRVPNESLIDPITSPNQETRFVAVETSFSFKPEILSTSPDTPQFNNGQKQDKKNGTMSELESLYSDIGTQGQVRTRFPPSYIANGEKSTNINESTSMTKKSLNDLGSVLDALQLAKLSLKHKLSAKSISEDGFSMKDSIPMTNMNSIIEIPVGYPPRLFRVPVDFQSQKPSIGNYSHTDSTLSRKQYMERGSRTYTNATPSIELRSGILPPVGISSSFSSRNIGFAPILDDNRVFPTERSPYLDPRMNLGYPFSSKYTYPSYPASPDVTPHLSLSGRFSKDTLGVELGMPSNARFALFGDQIRPNLNK